MDATSRHAVLTVMRMVEDRVNSGTVPPHLDALRRSGDERNHLVSTVTVTMLELIVSMLENIDL